MRHMPLPDMEKESTRSKRGEFELPSQVANSAFELGDPDHLPTPMPVRREERVTRSVREKAMAASAPGSEYWLP